MSRPVTAAEINARIEAGVTRARANRARAMSKGNFQPGNGKILGPKQAQVMQLLRNGPRTALDLGQEVFPRGGSCDHAVLVTTLSGLAARAFIVRDGEAWRAS